MLIMISILIQDMSLDSNWIGFLSAFSLPSGNGFGINVILGVHNSIFCTC